MKKNLSLRLFATLVFVFAACAVSLAQGQPQQPLAEYIRNNYTKREVMIPMRDGVRLFTAIYEPKDASQKYPVLLDRTPYSVGPYGPENFKTSLGPDELFPREGEIPAEHALIAPIHQACSLTDGVLKPWKGKVRTVRSPICVRRANGAH